MEQTTLSKYVKAMRKQYNLTQVELSEKSGVGLRLVRELEQGKQTLRLDKVNQILNLFGSEVGVVSITKSDMLSTALVMPEDTRGVGIDPQRQETQNQEGRLRGFNASIGVGR